MMLAMTGDDYDQRSLQRRREVLALPMVALQHPRHLAPTNRLEWRTVPDAVGVGPEGAAYAVWPHSIDSRRKQVASYTEAGLGAVAEIQTQLRVRFVQPLPGDQLLLVAARARRQPLNAEIWNWQGQRTGVGQLGDAIESLLTTPSGKVWVGYFDEALGGRGPEGHGLARFSSSLDSEWLYPGGSSLPSIVDCYTLNVDGEDAYCCPYTGFHLLAMRGDTVTDRGPAPHHFADGLLIDGTRGALIGGQQAEYDQATPMHLDTRRVAAAGAPRRIVRPNGIEIAGRGYQCRGPNLHVFINNTWYQIGLDTLTAPPPAVSI
ncbi:hypothetical protein [Actinocatenispora comari]|nr:hypothetical protein [Actinocatenispora comari]